MNVKAMRTSCAKALTQSFSPFIKFLCQLLLCRDDGLLCSTVGVVALGKMAIPNQTFPVSEPILIDLSPETSCDASLFHTPHWLPLRQCVGALFVMLFVKNCRLDHLASLQRKSHTNSKIICNPCAFSWQNRPIAMASARIGECLDNNFWPASQRCACVCIDSLCTKMGNFIQRSERKNACFGTMHPWASNKIIRFHQGTLGILQTNQSGIIKRRDPFATSKQLQDGRLSTRCCGIASCRHHSISKKIHLHPLLLAANEKTAESTFQEPLWHGQLSFHLSKTP